MIRAARARRYGKDSGLIEESVAIEEPLLVRVDQQDVAILMRTPGDDENLAAGFLFTEGLLEDRSDIADISPSRHPTSAECHVTLKPGKAIPPAAARNFYRTSSCGVCGRTAIDVLTQRLPSIEELHLDPGILHELPAELEARQSAFAATGGLHAAGLFDAQGRLLTLAEDIGRHNALDKIIGRKFLDGTLPARAQILVMSSRASFDIIQKAATAAIPVVATIGAPSSLAIDLARAAGLVLYGFLRSDRVTQYTGI